MKKIEIITWKYIKSLLLNFTLILFASKKIRTIKTKQQRQNKTKKTRKTIIIKKEAM